MKDYVDVCAVDDIPNGKHRAFLIDGTSILVFRINADAYALENRCTHLDFPLEGGRQIGTTIVCRKHGARFDICSGKVVTGPAVDPLRCFSTRVRQGRIEVQPGATRNLGPFIAQDI
ncbi:non-heme iron oxygenase ferredoxin subunit [Sphingobium sp. CR2-8]|uniref:Rieske (2Fe-2S) protein n=1 Tax=Sphingobium sp. CR2-8 TaxID=1306534 RepID=UPI002DBD7607|nr:non-heme iron oxygenase ferredoxin subunit [Sphingobium sp. CR2-8]MEC3909132.1 non-heme iron oxygenase ferredoxin subunit [Sphingobium sp. CR2-8]